MDQLFIKRIELIPIGCRSYELSTEHGPFAIFGDLSEADRKTAKSLLLVMFLESSVSTIEFNETVGNAFHVTANPDDWDVFEPEFITALEAIANREILVIPSSRSLN